MSLQSSEASKTDEVVVHMTPPSSKIGSDLPPLPAEKDRPGLTSPAAKPKSRFLELNCPPKRTRSTPAAAAPLPFSSDDSSDDDRPISDRFLSERCHRRRLRIGLRAAAEAVALVPATALLGSSLAVESLRPRELWGVKIWRWCVVLMAIFSGRLISGWIVWLAVFLIERHFLLQEKVLYFVYGLRKSVRGCVWLGLVLLACWKMQELIKAKESGSKR